MFRFVTIVPLFGLNGLIFTVVDLAAIEFFGGLRAWWGNGRLMCYWTNGGEAKFLNPAKSV
jgi:hypothetical protein